MPVTGGAEKQLISEPVIARGFSVLRDGIYYISSRDRNVLQFSRTIAVSFGLPVMQSFRTNEIRFYDFASRHSRTVAEIAGPLGLGLSASPDRKTFLFSKFIPASDLMLIENFGN